MRAAHNTVWISQLPANQHQSIFILQTTYPSTMIPFEALLPYGIIIGLFTFAGAGMNAIHVAKNNGYRERYATDQWEQQMMERDFRLTGEKRKQSDSPVAAEAFKTSSLWKIHKAY